MIHFALLQEKKAGDQVRRALVTPRKKHRSRSFAFILQSTRQNPFSHPELMLEQYFPHTLGRLCPQIWSTGINLI